MTVYSISHAGHVADVTSQATCHAGDVDVLQVRYITVRYIIRFRCPSRRRVHCMRRRTPARADAEESIMYRTNVLVQMRVQRNEHKKLIEKMNLYCVDRVK